MAHDTIKSRIVKRPRGVYRLHWSSYHTDGNSQTDVIDRAFNEAEKMIDSVKGPRFIFHNYRGYSAVVGHDGIGPYYVLAHPDGSETRVWVHAGMERAEHEARNHAAQLAWQDGETTSDIITLDIHNFAGYAKHQQDFLNAKKAVISAGMYEADAHKYIMDWFTRRHRHDCDTADIARLALEEYTSNQLVLAIPEPDYTPYAYDDSE